MRRCGRSRRAPRSATTCSPPSSVSATCRRRRGARTSAVDAGAHVDAELLAATGGDQLAGERLHRRQQPAARESVTVGAERRRRPSPSRRPTTPPPMTASAPGTSLGAGRLAAGPRRASRAARRCRAARPPIRCDRDRVPGASSTGAAVGVRHGDLDARPGEPAVAADEVDAGRVEPRHLAVVVPVAR